MSNYPPDRAKHPEAGRVLRFWFGEPAQYGSPLKCWFAKDSAFDARIKEDFAPLRERLASGEATEWLAGPADCLAYIVVLDQFSRHIHRGSGRAFEADALALRAARLALEQGFDQHFLPVELLFVCLPFQHSETITDQHVGCELAERLRKYPETQDVYGYAVAHRDIVQRFGRFPHRNAALGRKSSAEEIEFLKQPGSSF